MYRRDFIKNSGLTVAGIGLSGLTMPAVFAQDSTKKEKEDSTVANVSLNEKFCGCIYGSQIGSAMGAPCEGWLYPAIEEKYGTIEELMPYEHYDNGWLCDAGTTEDGIERQKLMITAIMRKGGRVNAEDVRAVWRTEINPKAPGMVSEPFNGGCCRHFRCADGHFVYPREMDSADGCRNKSKSLYKYKTNNEGKCGWII